MFELAQYRNPETGRYQWAVFCTKNHVWYFAKRYGKAAAQAYCNHLNKTVSE